MIKTSLELVWSTPTVFGNLKKMFRKICLTFRTFLKNLQIPSENHQKCCH